MKLFLVEHQPVFGITSNTFRKTVCFSPTNKTGHDRRYCNVLGKILKDKHYKSKDLDIMLQFILPVPGKTFGSIRIYDAFFTLKILGQILNDPDMKIVVSVSNKWLIGPGKFISTKEMSLDPNAFPIIPICTDDKVNIDILKPELDLLEHGSTPMFVSVCLEFDPRRRQEMLSKSPAVESDEQRLKSKGQTVKLEVKSSSTERPEEFVQPEQPASQCKEPLMSSDKPERLPRSSAGHLKEQVSKVKELLLKPNSVVKSKKRRVNPDPSVQLKLRQDLPESIMRTIYQLNLEDSESEEETVEPEKLKKSEVPDQRKLTLIKPEVQNVQSEKPVVAQSDDLVGPFEKPTIQHGSSVDHLKEPPTEEFMLKENPIVKANIPKPPVQQVVKPNITEIKPEVQIVSQKPIAVSAELRICRKIIQEEIATDAIIITKEGISVNCHKSFLMAHSDVFTEMFQIQNEEGLSTNKLEINDMTEKGVRALLAYLYCWDQSEANDYSSVAFELLSAGNKYDIPLLMTSMKNVILGKPSVWFDPDVIVKLFKFARTLLTAEGTDLKQKAIKLMKENLPKVEQCSAYKELFKENPEVAMELCRIAFSA